MDKQPYAHEQLDDVDYTVYVIQCILAVTPMHPKWCDVRKTVFPNWEDWEAHDDHVSSHFSNQFWNDIMAFHTEKTARAFVDHLSCFDLSKNDTFTSMRQVRIVRRHRQQTETLIV